MLTSDVNFGDFWLQKREVQKKCQKDARVNGDFVTHQHARPSSCCISANAQSSLRFQVFCDTC